MSKCVKTKGFKGANFFSAHTAIAGNDLSCAEPELECLPIEQKQHCTSGVMYQRSKRAPAPTLGQLATTMQQRSEPTRAVRGPGAWTRARELEDPWGRPARNPRIPAGPRGGAAGRCNQQLRRFGTGMAVRRQAATGGGGRGGGVRGFGGARGFGGKLSGASNAGKGRGEEASTNRGSARIRARRVAAGGPGQRRLLGSRLRCRAGVNDWVQK